MTNIQIRCRATDVLHLELQQQSRQEALPMLNKLPVLQSCLPRHTRVVALLLVMHHNWMVRHTDHQRESWWTRPVHTWHVGTFQDSAEFAATGMPPLSTSLLLAPTESIKGAEHTGSMRTAKGTGQASEVDLAQSECCVLTGWLLFAQQLLLGALESHR
jgi:hypothetical protein